MMRIDDVHAIKCIAAASRVQFVPTLHHCVARYSASDKLLGGVLYTDYWGGSVMMHFAGFAPNWASRGLIWLAFDYPFRQLGVRKVFGMIPEWNLRSRNTALHLGFKIEYLAEDVFNMDNGVNGMYLISMRREACKWLDMNAPFIEYAPPERTNNINLPLAHMEPVGMMQ